MTDWVALTGRVVVEACCPTAEDVVLYAGESTAAEALRPRVGTLVQSDALPPTPGVSIIVLHHWLRRRPPAEQRAAFQAAARILPERGVLVVGDVMWSLRADLIDEPEQFGDSLDFVQTTDTLERWAREAGFLPDLHRFGPGVGVLVAVRGLA